MNVWLHLHGALVPVWAVAVALLPQAAGLLRIAVLLVVEAVDP